MPIHTGMNYATKASYVSSIRSYPRHPWGPGGRVWLDETGLQDRICWPTRRRTAAGWYNSEAAPQAVMDARYPEPMKRPGA